MKTREGAYPAIPKTRESVSTPRKRKRADSGGRRKNESKGPKTSTSKKHDSVAEEELFEIKPGLKLLPVGLDLGTTYTGVAYAPSVLSDPAQIQVITDWPGGASVNSHQVKCKTIIAYPKQNPENKKVKDVIIGYQVLPGMTSCSLFKIRFDEAAPPSPFDDPLLEAAEGLTSLPPDMSAPKVAQDFFKCVYDHVRETLNSVYTTEMMQTTRILWILTVPAFWSNQAKSITLEAARQAGITTSRYRKRDKIILVTEPEAAALSVLTSTHGPFKFETQTSVLIVDAGGLTVDLAVYKIKEVEPQLKLDEAAVGIGAKCGSTAINRGVFQWMEDRFGKAFSTLSIEKIGDGSKFMNEVEKAKQDLDSSDEDETIRLGLKMPDLAPTEDVKQYYDFDEGEVLLPRSDFKKMFLACAKSVLELITQQLEEVPKKGKLKMPPVKTVVLVGGFANSKLIYNEVKAFCQSRNLQLIRPDNGWSAIVKGAAIKGLRKSWIGSVKGRQWLGISVNRAFREGIDDEKDSFICPLQGKRAPGYMQWLVKKGERLKPNTKRPIEVSFVLGEDDEAVWSCTLYSSCLDKAPERVTPNDVIVEGEIKVNVSKVPEAKTQTIDDSGAKVSVVNVTVNVTLGSDEGTLGVASIVNGKRCGYTTIRYSAGFPFGDYC